MDLSFGPEHERFREEVREFLAEHWPAGDGGPPPGAGQEASFRALAIERGYVYRRIPRRYGGSEQPADPLREDILRREFFAAGAPLGIPGVGPAMLVPTLLEHGSEEQREEFVAPTLRGEIRWCQGYSEPGSGSDLASLQTRAEPDGDEWVVNGHKIWTSSAHLADWMFGLFRTEPGEPRHAGISYLLLPMRQPGVEVRPLRQMTGTAEFNEVFFDDARTPLRNIVGRRGQGWKVSRTTLVHERNMIGDPARVQNLFSDLVELARGARLGGRPALEDGGVRRRLVELEGYVRAQQYSGYRQLSATAHGREDRTRLPTLMNKLYTTELVKRLLEFGYDLIDSDESLAAPDENDARARLARSANYPGGWTTQYLYAHGASIAGGSPNIQRNIIGERGLGLPRDLRQTP
ncbi:MAG: acyl-CoA dehydrogenase family protein [Proteobacteria bacterium]|nr:acyl-CoA dehydrogenase family protein [Pseudomonadota bacterium]